MTIFCRCKGKGYRVGGSWIRTLKNLFWQYLWWHVACSIWKQYMICSFWEAFLFYIQAGLCLTRTVLMDLCIKVGIMGMRWGGAWGEGGGGGGGGRWRIISYAINHAHRWQSLQPPTHHHAINFKQGWGCQQTKGTVNQNLTLFP